MSQRSNQQKVEHIGVDKLKVSKRQARTHPEPQIQALANSISRFGFTMPILVDEDGRILAGHGRLLAARRLGMEQVPCLRVHHLSEEEKRAFVLADNRLSEMARWDKGILASELQDLGDLGFPLELTGFDLPAIELLLEEVAEASPDAPIEREDEIPEPQAKAATQRGDKWLLGRHELFCGDARDPGAYVQLLGSREVDAVFTDPPYNRSMRRHVSRQGARQHGEFIMASGEMSEDAFTVFLTEALGSTGAVCRDGAIAFVCMDWRHMRECITAGEEVGLELKNLVVWNKTNAGLGTFYRSKHELVFVWKVGTAPHTNTFGLGDKGRYRTNVWTYAGVNTFKPERAEELESHPTVKPVALVADAIRDVSHRGQLVLDPFGGSGTTLIAAEKTGRSARLVELDPAYCDVIVRRFETLTGTFARHATTNERFDELAVERFSHLNV